MDDLYFDNGIEEYCDHERQDRVQLRVGDAIQYIAPRCLDCGQMQREGGDWISLPILVLVFIRWGHHDSVKRCIELMEEGRKQLGIPYPDYTEEDYKRYFEGIRGTLDEQDKFKIN